MHYKGDSLSACCICMVTKNREPGESEYHMYNMKVESLFGRFSLCFVVYTGSYYVALCWPGTHGDPSTFSY